MIMLNQASHHLLVGIKDDYGPSLILSNEAAIAFYIRLEGGSEFAFNFLGGHGTPQRLVGRLIQNPVA
jgi:hypothetical protein